MKKSLLFLIIALISVSIALLMPQIGPASSGNGPETIDLKAKYSIKGKKKAVIFPHRNHQKKLKCVKCHKSPEGGALKVEIKKLKGMSNDFHKKFCWPCHVEMKVKKGKTCKTCHK